MIHLSRIWKLYIAYTLLLVGGMTLAGFVLDFQINRQLKAHLAQDALAAARVVALCLPADERPEGLAAFCRWYREAAGWRLTLVRPDGIVVADSDELPGRMANHSDRPEIRQALADGQAVAVRLSPTLGDAMLYGAHFDPRRRLTVRVALPMSRVKQVENEVMAVAAVLLYFVPLLCAVGSFFAARALTAGPRRDAPR